MSFPREDKLIKSQHLYEQRKLLQKTSTTRILRTPCEVLVDMYPSLTPIWNHILYEYIRPSYEQKKLPWVCYKDQQRTMLTTSMQDYHRPRTRVYHYLIIQWALYLYPS
jgi:hypothetical protein